MEIQKLNEYCKTKKILLDTFLIELLIEFEEEFVIFFLSSLFNYYNKKFMNKAFFIQNNKQIKIILKQCSINFKKDEELIESYFINKLNIKKLEKNVEDIKIKKKNEKKEFNNVKILSSFLKLGKKIEVNDFIIHFRNRYEKLKKYIEDKGIIKNFVSIGRLVSSDSDISVIGMIVSKKTTKNNNIILEIEDLTGKINVLINKDKEDLILESEDIALDSVIGFNGDFVGKKMFFVKQIVFPETSLSIRKKSNVDECALFIGDLHYGSKNFLKEDFLKFVNYLSDDSNNKETNKIKYLFIVGDLVTGIGNYPGQENDLIVNNLEEQYIHLAEMLSRIRKDIKIIISPGNHDGVRLMEPQPPLDEKYAWPLYNLENVIITENPSLINIGKNNLFEGFNVLTYHGFSFPYYANTIPKLMVENSMNNPEKIMKYLLRNRHLAPTHASNQYFPSEKDALLIEKIPDIFVSGHSHKSGVTYSNNILLISVSSWEGLTSYQEKFGNKPDHCKVPMLNLKTKAIKILDFETVKEGEKNE